MSALEDEILNRFRQLDEPGKRRLLNILEREVAESRLSPGEWLRWAEAFRAELVAKHGSVEFGIQDALDEVREEASWLPR